MRQAQKEAGLNVMPAEAVAGRLSQSTISGWTPLPLQDYNLWADLSKKKSGPNWAAFKILFPKNRLALLVQFVLCRVHKKLRSTVHVGHEQRRFQVAVFVVVAFKWNAAKTPGTVQKTVQLKTRARRR